MVWVPLSNASGQVVKGIKLKAPKGAKVGNEVLSTPKTFTVGKTSRKGINRYEITLHDEHGNEHKVFNHNIRVKKDNTKEPAWSLVGRFHTPEELAKIYNRSKVDPDANLPRPMRASFWKMKSKPGTHNYKQKVKLMKDPQYIKSFKQYFADTLDEETLNEGPKDAAGKDVFVKKIAKSAGTSYEKAGAIAAAAGRKRLGKAEFDRRAAAGRRASAKAHAKGQTYKG